MVLFNKLEDVPQDERNRAVIVYSDGSSSGRADKPGGWGYVVLLDGLPVDAGNGGLPKTTNNVMEMEGAIQGLLAVMRKGLHKLGKRIILAADSQYTLGIGAGSYTPSKNIEQATRLRALVLRMNVETRWVRGHAGEVWNERVDGLATLAKEKIKESQKE